jgi:hypothetical protein
MGGGRVAKGKAAEDDQVRTVRSMPSEAARTALMDLAVDVLNEELVDDRFSPGAQGEQADPSGSSASETSGADSSTWEPPSAEERAEQGASLLGQIVDVFVGARRLSNWALWMQLAAAAHLVSRWQSSPPIVDGALPDLEKQGGTASPAGALARRLWRVVDKLDIWGPVDTGDLAEEFVAAEISAAAGLSHYGSKNVVDAARTLFMTDRLPRTRQLLRAGLLDWNKLRTILTTTQSLDDMVCQLVEAAVIPDADLAVADPLDTLADPARPGRDLPRVARLNNPALQAALIEAITAMDAEAAARRAAKARRDRYVSGKPLPDAMGRIEITTGQDEVVAVLAGLDHAVAAAKHAGDTRTADQIRTDHAIHLLTEGAHGADAYPVEYPAEHDDEDDHKPDDENDQPQDDQPEIAGSSAPKATGVVDGGGRGRAGASSRTRRRAGRRRYGRRGLQVRLTIPLGTWLGLAEDPAVLDGYGPLPAALARQIAAEAARDHPTTTTWRCVVVHDRHATVLGVGDIVPTTRYTPTDRQKTFVRTADTYCTYPGCRTQAWHCDIDHRRPYDHDNPNEGGPTCTCNLHSLCRRHHRLKTAGLITPHLVDTANEPCGDRLAPVPDEEPVILGEIPGDIPPGSIEWRTWTGRRYTYQPPRATPAPADPEVVTGCATLSRRAEHDSGESPWLGSEDPALAHWDRARLRLLEREAALQARRSRHGARNLAGWQAEDSDAPPPF